jgi:hypothetical protein
MARRVVVLHTVPYIRRSLCLENIQSGMPGSNNETRHGVGFVTVWSATSWYSVGPIVTLHGRIAAREYLQQVAKSGEANDP